jgi:fused signal recognition particle receptor
MDELGKVARVVNKAQPGAPHETFLVIDATMGQNAIAQAREFAQATPITGIVLSKLDGTAKGGVAIGIVDELGLPIRYIGIGEKESDLKDFDAKQFVDALFDEA